MWYIAPNHLRAKLLITLKIFLLVHSSQSAHHLKCVPEQHGTCSDLADKTADETPGQAEQLIGGMLLGAHNLSLSEQLIDHDAYLLLTVQLGSQGGHQEPPIQLRPKLQVPVDRQGTNDVCL